jgi:predicted transcriptional regulator
MSEIKKESPEINDSEFIDGINLEEYNLDIETAMKEMDEGKYYTHEEVVKSLLK